LEEVKLGDVSPDVRAERTRQLMWIVVFQAIFLAITYAAGVWLSTEVTNASITLPEVDLHGTVSAAFAILTGLVGFLAGVQKKRGIAIANSLLFVFTVAAGATGFSFLGNTTDPTGMTVTNLSMMIAIGLAMPVTGYTLSRLSQESRGEAHSWSSATVMSYMALGALALTIIVGAAVPSASLYAIAVAAHVGLGALTVALVLGVLMLTVLEGTEAVEERPHWVAQRIGYSLLSLASICIAAGDGVIASTGGGLSYVVVMAEAGTLVYGFLLFAIAAPYHPTLHLGPFSRILKIRTRSKVSSQ
jgi:MFS family permease